jgi:transposase
MTQYRKILRLSSQGISKRDIASSYHCSRNTITAVLERAEQCGISWPLPSMPIIKSKVPGTRVIDLLC